MRILLALLPALLLAGCEPQMPAEDLLGVWRSADSNADFILLELREDGSFVRTAQVAGMRVRNGGTYQVEHNAIRLKLAVEHISGASPETMQGDLVIPFRLEALSLVLYPESDREQRMILVQ